MSEENEWNDPPGIVDNESGSQISAATGTGRMAAGSGIVMLTFAIVGAAYFGQIEWAIGMLLALWVGGVLLMAVGGFHDE